MAGAGGKKNDKVYNWIRAYIDENRFSGSSKLPSENVLCMKFNISRETVRSAFNRLKEEGLIYKIRGSGTYFNKEATLTDKRGNPTSAAKIGLILQGQDSHANSGLISGIKSVLSEKEADLQLFFTENKFASERSCLEVVAHQSFDGFIVDGVKASILNPNLDCYRGIFHRKIPVIFYNNYYKELKFPRVINNDLKCADELLRRLVRAGHRNIAGIFVYDNYQSIEKFRGYVNAMRKYGAYFDDDDVKWCVSNEAHAPGFYREVGRFLKRRPKCTAIVCCNYMILQAVMKAAAKLEKKIPDDYSVVCFDYSGDDWEEAGITCSIHPGFSMGQEVGKRLMRMIENKDFFGNDYTYVFEPRIYEGGSIRTLTGAEKRKC